MTLSALTSLAGSITAGGVLTLVIPLAGLAVIGVLTYLSTRPRS